MADRVIGVSGIIYADLPGYVAPVTVTVTNPLGTAVATAAATTDQGAFRFSYPLTPTMAGLWTAAWTGAAGTTTRYFTVGDITAAGLTRWDLLMALARREHEVVEGYISGYQPGVLVDTALRGGAGSYLGRYAVLHPDAGVALAGRYRRVTSFNGSSLNLDRPFSTDPSAETRYALINVPPLELEAAVKKVFDDMSERGRIPLRISGIPLVTTTYTRRLELTLPAGFTRVDTLWVDNCVARSTVEGMELAQSMWEPRPGRKVVVAIDGLSLAAGDTLIARGNRQMRVPAFWDSEIDVEASPLIAGAAKELLATRAGGPAVDVEEHLRRMLVAQQEFEATVRHSAGRPEAGSRLVIP